MLFFRICQVLTEQCHTRSFNSVTSVNFACKVCTGTCTRKKTHHIINAKNIWEMTKLLYLIKTLIQFHKFVSIMGSTAKLIIVKKCVPACFIKR